jgi:hypothetical protein
MTKKPKKLTKQKARSKKDFSSQPNDVRIKGISLEEFPMRVTTLSIKHENSIFSNSPSLEGGG